MSGGNVLRSSMNEHVRLRVFEMVVVVVGVVEIGTRTRKDWGGLGLRDRGIQPA